MNERVKYPRTYHLPWSEGRTDDDKVLSDDSQFIGKHVIVTEKMDGENTTIYPDGYIHARSIDGKSKPWQSWLYGYIYPVCATLPKGRRICGENLYAKHSISYDNEWSDIEWLFQVFGIYDDKDNCVDWEETIHRCAEMGLHKVPLIWCGKYDRDDIIKTFNEYKKLQRHEVEGYVIRTDGSFPLADF